MYKSCTYLVKFILRYFVLFDATVNGTVFFFFFFQCLFIFETERETETECEWGRGREREADTESEAGSRLRAVSTQPDTGL